VRNVLITGGSGGIASGITYELKKLNCEVIKPSRAYLDVTDNMSINSFFDSNSKVDVLINNAGAIYTQPLKDSDTWLWENVVRVNLLGTYRMTRAALRANKKTVIINISSMSAYQYFENFSAYASSKAGIVAMTKCLAQEGVKAYSVCPGGVDTPFRDKLMKNATEKEKNRSHFGKDDLLDPKEVGQIVSDILQEKYDNGSSILIRKNDIFEVR